MLNRRRLPLLRMAGSVSQIPMGMCTFSGVLGAMRGSSMVHLAAATRGSADGGGIAYANAIVIVIGDVRRFSARQIALASGPYGRPFALTDRSTR